MDPSRSYSRILIYSSFSGLYSSFGTRFILKSMRNGSIVNIEKMVSKLSRVTIIITHYLCWSRFMILHRHVCIVFLPNPPVAMLELPNCLSHEWLTFLKYWLVRQEYNRARDDEGPHFCINQNKNIDNDFYSKSNEFSNHLFD